MTYSLRFKTSARKEWDKLGETVRTQFKKKLAEQLRHPHVPAARLSGTAAARYKIKLRASGYRLVYEVQDQVLTVTVIAVGRREDVYEDLGDR